MFERGRKLDSRIGMKVYSVVCHQDEASFGMEREGEMK